ncbi:MAG: glycosyltransferase, partial [Nitrososphaerales archaeon]
MTAPVPVNLVSAFKTFTGSTNVAKDYYDALRVGGLAPTWYQCISSRNRQEWDTWGKSISGLTWFGDDANVVLNSLTVFPRKIRPLGKDWVLLTDPILLPAARHLPRVAVIVHDMREFSVHRRGRLATWVYHQLFRNIRKVSHIICVSESTRNALTSFARLSVPITVVHPSARVAGNVESHIARSQSRLRDDQPMRVLYMAADRPYKNIEFFIQLAKHFDPPSTKGTRFVFTLVSRLGPSSRATLSRLHPGNLDVVPRVDEVGPLYDAVDIVVHPSMIEGFGLPLAEA